jgi:ankyrin repeat protein
MLTDGEYPIHACVASGTVVLKTLLDMGVDIAARDREANTALHVAVRNRSFPLSLFVVLMDGGRFDWATLQLCSCCCDAVQM